MLRFVKDALKCLFQKQTIQAIKKYQNVLKKRTGIIGSFRWKDSMALWSVLTDIGNQITAIHLDLGIPNFSKAISSSRSTICSRIRASR